VSAYIMLQLGKAEVRPNHADAGNPDRRHGRFNRMRTRWAISRSDYSGGCLDADCHLGA
jgi:hypothetical protein